MGDSTILTSEVIKTRDQYGRLIINQYLLQEEIGKGMHGKVRKATDLDTGEQWVRNSINKS